MINTMLLTTTGSSYLFVTAQQLDPTQKNVNNPSNDNTSRISNGTLPRDIKTQSLGDSGNQLSLTPGSIRENQIGKGSVGD